MSENVEFSTNQESKNPVNEDLNHKVQSKLSTALVLKEEGNQLFTHNKIKEAIRCYHKALLYIKGVENDASDLLGNISRTSSLQSEESAPQKIDPIIMERNKQLKLDCYNNLSACLLKTSKPDFEKVVFYCQEVISITPNNPKAHYRMAQALYFLKDFEGALQACEHSLLCQDTHDKKTLKLKTTCTEQLSKQTSHQKVMYRKMLGLEK